MYLSWLKDTIKDTGEEPGEEIHRARSGRVLSTEASVPKEMGCVTLAVWMCSSPWKISIPHTLGILWRHFQPLPLPGEVGLEIPSFWLWLGLSGGTPPSPPPHPGSIQEPTQGHLIRTKDAPRITSEITGVLGLLHQKLGWDQYICFLLSHNCILEGQFMGVPLSPVSSFFSWLEY